MSYLVNETVLTLILVRKGKKRKVKDIFRREKGNRERVAVKNIVKRILNAKKCALSEERRKDTFFKNTRKYF